MYRAVKEGIHQGRQHQAHSAEVIILTPAAAASEHRSQANPFPGQPGQPLHQVVAQVYISEARPRNRYA